MLLEPIRYIDRRTGQTHIEKVYGGAFLQLLYGKSIGRPLRHLVSRSACFSRFVGWLQCQSWTRRNIGPFVQSYGVDPSEFDKPVAEFSSFADFFVRKLKKEARPIAAGAALAVMPADGRYYFFENVSAIGPFDIKGQTFNLSSLLQDTALAERYANASMVLARLCPSDYHRFHFPVDGTPNASRLINGYLYSVNPWAIRQNVRIFAENRRRITTIASDQFGEVLFLEIGATSVGTIIETYTPDQPCYKGEEKGYFNFGGSALIILFPQGRIRFDADLLAATRQNLEILCLMGQSMGTALAPC